MRRIVSSKWMLGVLAMLGVLVGLGIWQRTPIRAWFVLRQLQSCSADEAEYYVKQAQSLDVAIVPGLLALWKQENSTVCDRSAAVLEPLSARWGAEDAHSLELFETIQAEFAHLSVPGKRAAMHVLAADLRQPTPKQLPTSLTRSAGLVVQSALPFAELRAETLVLAAALVERIPPGQWLHVCRDLANEGLNSKEASVRIAALQLMLSEPMKQDAELMAKALPMLRDPAAPVRRAALVLLAGSRDVVSEEPLLPLLHDPDLEVQHLCEVALRSRGLHDRHIELARLISDASPTARLRVLALLSSDLDPAVWLRRLSQDHSPAVRAAAVRAAGMNPRLDLRDRLQEMAQRDPSETVRENARHYLNRVQ